MAVSQMSKETFLKNKRDKRHGTDGAYTNYGCRCKKCRAAHAQKARNERALKGLL